MKQYAGIMAVLTVVFAIGCNESPTEVETATTARFHHNPGHGGGGGPGGGGGGPDFLATIEDFGGPDGGLVTDVAIEGVNCPTDGSAVNLVADCLVVPLVIGGITMVEHGFDDLLTVSGGRGSKEIVAIKLRLMDDTGQKYRSDPLATVAQPKALDRKATEEQELVVQAADIRICAVESWSSEEPPCSDSDLVGEVRIGTITYVKP